MVLASFVLSVCFIVLTCFLAHTARQIINAFINEPFVRLLFQEAIAAAEMCACCFELIVVTDNYGVSMYAIFLFLLTIWWSLSWGDASACPYTHLEDFIQGKMDLREAFLRSWAELTGGILVFRYVQLFWGLELITTYQNRAYSECVADLQVPMLFGAMIEGIATCLCRLASKALSDLNPRLGPAIDSFIATSLVVAAFDYSGGYFNPVLATSLKYGCRGNTFIEHMVVYWLGACMGAVASVYIYNNPKVQRMIFGEDQKKEV